MPIRFSFMNRLWLCPQACSGCDPSGGLHSPLVNVTFRWNRRSRAATLADVGVTLPTVRATSSSRVVVRAGSRTSRSRVSTFLMGPCSVTPGGCGNTGRRFPVGHSHCRKSSSSPPGVTATSKEPAEPLNTFSFRGVPAKLPDRGLRSRVTAELGAGTGKSVLQSEVSVITALMQGLMVSPVKKTSRTWTTASGRVCFHVQVLDVVCEDANAKPMASLRLPPPPS
mmetsp:Transcript_39062/g.116696  ORF Transcript_39062/g.116696 Transcript_39062/m.116696 type:complete len:225 (+) Transcript_39062:226-900(+)